MCLRFWKLRAGGANKKRKIYYCRPTNPNVKVNGGAMKRFKGFNPVLFAAAVIFLCVTVYSLVSNVTGPSLVPESPVLLPGWFLM